MATLNQIIKERKAVLKALQAPIRTLEDKVQAALRLLSRLRSRRLNVPESTDLSNLIQLIREADQQLDVVSRAMQASVNIFTR